MGLVTALVSDSLLGSSCTVPALHGNDLQVHGAKVHAVTLPSVEVVGHGNGTASSATIADGDVLVECCGAGDGGCVDTLSLPDGV